MDNEKELLERIADLRSELATIVERKGYREYAYCGDCKTAKPIEEFGLTKRKTPLCYCRQCWNARTAEYKKTGHARIASRDKERMRRADKRHREEQRVRSLLKRKIRMGLYPSADQRNCSQCGEPAKEYHHHNGYDIERWDDVIPVCYKCHRRLHGKDS